MKEVAEPMTVRAICLWAIRLALRRWNALAAVMASIIFHTGIDVLRPWPMIVVLDYVLAKQPPPAWLADFIAHLPGNGSPLDIVKAALVAIVVIFLIGWAAKLAGEYPTIALTQGMTYDLAEELFAKLQQLSLQHHSRAAVGDNVVRILSDCSCASSIVRNALLPAFWSLCTLVAIFVILYRISPGLALLSLLAAPSMAFVLARNSEAMRAQSSLQRQREGAVNALLEDGLNSVGVTQAFCREEGAEKRFETAARSAFEAERNVVKIQIKFGFQIGMVTAIATAGAYWIGARMASSGDLTPGAIVAFLSYLAALYTPLQTFVNTGSTINGALGSAHRVWEILKLQPQVAEMPGAQPLPANGGDIEFQNVTFSYERSVPVLKDVALKISPGETVAIVGHSGSGKSTLASLVMRFIDADAGRVLINGCDVREVQLKSLREQVGLLLQEPFMIPGTIAENIAFGVPGASHAQIVEAARAANVHTFITSLENGYDTIIGERGANLSGGERQRICIARALIKNAPILILDEPTSALDAETELEVMQALNTLAVGRTTIIIAHRLTTVRNADRIVILKKGSIVEVGTHDELVERNGEYAAMFRMQIAPEPTPLLAQQ